MDALLSTLQAAQQQIASSALEACSDVALIALERHMMDISASCISRMRKLRNSRVAVSRLPDELLLEVFLTLWESCSEDDWLPISHVCSHWRALALGTPSLWTDMDYSYRDDLLEERLRRSQNMPLTVWSNDDGDAAPFCKLFSSHAHRIQSLGLSGDETLAIIHELAPRLSNLENLRISTSVRMVAETSRPCHFPKLHTLQASDVSFLHISPWIRALRSLNLQYVRSLSGHGVSSLLQALEACPLLENLEISNSLRGRVVLDATVDNRVVQMPRLKSVHISDRATPAVRYLCSHLGLPVDATVMLTLVVVAVEDPANYDILPNVTCWPALAAMKRLTVALSITTLSVELDLEPTRSPGKYPLPRICVSFTPKNTDWSISAAFSEVMEKTAVALASLNIVHVSANAVLPLAPEDRRDWHYCYPPFSQSVWPCVLASFPSLLSLNLRCIQDTKPLFEALATPNPAFNTLPCAELKSLAIDADMNILAQDVLRDALSVRASRGNHIAELSLTLAHASGQSEFIEALKRHVGALVINDRKRRLDTDVDEDEDPDESGPYAEP